MIRNFLANLPSGFKEIVTSFPKFDGEKWLANLPNVIEECERKWSLTVLEHFPNLSYNYVAPCKLENGGEAVLKIGLPVEEPSIDDEARALKLYSGRGAVKLIDFDAERKALLIEKVSPGKDLYDLFEDKQADAIAAAVQVLKDLQIKPPRVIKLPSTQDWFDSFNEKRGEFRLSEFDKASHILLELTAEGDQDYVLHGDFHHANILFSDHKGFLAIDPKGVAGNLGYEIAVFLNQHAAWLEGDANIGNHLDRTVDQFSDAFNIPPKILKKWAWTQRVLGAWWNYEDNIGNWQDYLAFAEIWE